MINYTIQEVRRFFIYIFERAKELTIEFLDLSSKWRRTHQFFAKKYHYIKRYNLQL